MDQDQRDPRDWPEERKPEDAAEQPPAPADEPTRQPEPAAPGEPAPTEPDTGAPLEPPAGDTVTAEPASSEMESWPTQDSAPEAQQAPEADVAGDTRPWPTEPPATGEAEAGTWPTSAPERGDEAAAAGATPPPAEVEADTDESAWPVAGAAAGATAAGADVPGNEAEPPPGEAEAYPAAAAASAAAAGTAAHGVPDSEEATAESTKCPRCGTENTPGLAFCRSCGQRLVAAGVATTIERPGTPEGTMACPRCGTHNRSGVAFCQNCGANLRGTAPGYVPPAVAGTAAAATPAEETGGAILGPVVLIIGLIGLITGYLLPFAYGEDSLFERAFGSGGYGIAFWSAYPADASLADTLYFGLAAPVPIFAALLAVLAAAGFMKARPGALQTPGLVIALIWSVGLIVLFVVVELLGNWGGDIVDLLRQLTPGGIILFLASLIVLIGTLTRFGRS